MSALSQALQDLSSTERVVVALVGVVCVHLFVRLLRHASTRAMRSQVARRSTKAVTLISLISSSIVFALYFAAFGIVLTESGVPLSTYVASASIRNRCKADASRRRTDTPRRAQPTKTHHLMMILTGMAP